MVADGLLYTRRVVDAGIDVKGVDAPVLCIVFRSVVALVRIKRVID